MLLPVESQKPPQALLQQPMFDLHPGQAMDLVIPGDAPRDESEYWFVKMNRPDDLDSLWMPDPKAGNECMYLLGGEDTYNAIASALETTYKPGPNGEKPKDPFIYLANWTINFDFNLKRKGKQSEPATTLQHYLTTAAEGHGVMVRGIFWFRTRLYDPDQNRVERDYINKLSNGHAFLDGKHNWLGSHHQKLLLINGSEGLVAFAGGVDFNYDRVFAFNEKVPSPEGDLSNDEMKKTHVCTDAGSPLLDVHARIRGPAAYDLLDVFVRRYADHVSARGTTILAPYRDSRPRKSDRCYVRVCTTFGDNPSEQGEKFFVPNLAARDGLYGPAAEGKVDTVTIEGETPNPMASPGQPYWFAPKGRKSGLAQVLYGISSARRFIYFEDQYMVSEEIANAIRDASHRGVQVLGVIPHQFISPDFDHGYSNVLAGVRLSRVIRIVHGEKADPNKLNFLFCPVWDHQKTAKAERYQYIHSKVFIFDDAFCTIGSMNFNRRSTTHDSELCVGFHEPGSYRQLEFGFAHRLRMRLWARHLGFAESDLHLLADPLAAIKDYWSQVKYDSALTVGARKVVPNVERYDWTFDSPLTDRPVALRTEVNSLLDPGDDGAVTRDLPSQSKVPFPVRPESDKVMLPVF